MASYEAESGRAYRKVLSKYNGFYETLAGIVPELSFNGLKIHVKSTPEYNFKQKNFFTGNGWSSSVFERLGLPMYFSNEAGGILCLEGNDDKKFTDSQMLEAFKGNMFLASDTAENLIERGFLKYIGVEVKEWNGLTPTGELLLVNNKTTRMQMHYKELKPVSDTVKAYSYAFNAVGGGERTILFPAVTMYENELGGKVFVFCGTPLCKFNILEAFSFLTYSRKLQLIEILKETDNLKAYYIDDEEVYFKTAEMKDGTLFASIINLSFDKADEVRIYVGKKAEKIEMLMPDGTRKDVSFKENGENIYTLNASLEVLTPLILFIS